VKCYSVYSSEIFKINIFDVWGIDGSDWKPELFDLFVDGHMVGIDKMNIKINNIHLQARNVSFYLDFVMFFLPGHQCTQIIPKSHNYLNFVSPEILSTHL